MLDGGLQTAMNARIGIVVEMKDEGLENSLDNVVLSKA